MRTREPIVNAPPVVVAMLVLFSAVHILRNVVSDDLGAWILFAFALIPARYGAHGEEVPGAPWADFTSPVTHMFLHGDVTHLAMNSIWFLAVGTIAARRLGAGRFLVAFLVSGLAGAALFLVANPGAVVVMVGASGGISGLMGIVLRLLFSANTPEVRWLLSQDPRLVGLRSVGWVLRDRRAMTVVGVWVALNLVFALGWSDVIVDGKIAWEAHLGGFFCGFLLLALVDPGPKAGSEELPFGDERRDPEA